MELEPVAAQVNGMETFEALENLPFSHTFGARFSLEKFGEIYFASNRRIAGSTGTEYPSFFPTPAVVAPSGVKGLKDETQLSPGTMSSTYNENDELFSWSSNESKGSILGCLRYNGGSDGLEKSQQRRLEDDGMFANGNPFHGSGCKRKTLESDSSNKDLHDSSKGSKRIRKPWEFDLDNRCNTIGRREDGGGSKMPPWHVDVIEDMTADLDGSLSNLGADLGGGSYNMSEALLSLPSLTVFKQEAPSPSQDAISAIHTSGVAGVGPVQAAPGGGDDGGPGTDHGTTLHRLLQQNSFHGTFKRNNSNGLSKQPDASDKKTEDCRFQYVLAAATSIATKVTEETLTYLNQGQSYEIKLKKVGELSNFRGKILKSIIRICFHERRLQYMEKEQIFAWQASRPGERIIELDVPLSYGVFDVEQDPNRLNMLSFLWDPTKEVGAYIKVNCISTEFTPKKHGGEKGVPFRIQVETFIEGESARLHAAACQIKVFKLKGADRKHKQDREKILKRPLSEQDKYQPSYECTVLNDLHPEAVFSTPIPQHLSPTSTVSTRGTPTYAAIALSEANFISHGHLRPSPGNAVGKVDGPNVHAEANGEKCRSPATSLSDAVVNCQQGNQKLSPDSNCQQTSQWLRKNSFSNYVATFANFCGADILRLTRDDLIQICGLADGIRLLYALHSKAIVRLTLYICTPTSSVYHAVYLDLITRSEMTRKLATLLGVHHNQIHDVFLQGPNDIRVVVTDEVVSNIKDEAMFAIEILKDESRGKYALLLKPAGSST